MMKWVKISGLVVVLSLMTVPMMALAAEGAADPATAEVAVPATSIPSIVLGGGAIGSGLVIIGGAYGIGAIGSRAVESMSRQPEVAGNIQTAMIISAALIEGVTFFALLICLLSLYA